MQAAYSLDELASILESHKELKLAHVEFLLQEVSQLLKGTPSVVEIEGPTLVVGDLHGSWPDLQEAMTHRLEDGNILFLGDLVDRGPNSTECLGFVLTQFLKNPKKITMLRGNHEDYVVNKCFGFQQELHAQFPYDKDMISGMICKLWASLPIAAVGDKVYFCCHGGLPDFSGPEEARAILQRLKDTPLPLSWETILGTPMTRSVGQTVFPIIQAILWSDPASEEATKYLDSPRGIGSLWPPLATSTWCEANGFKAIIRAHEMVEGIIRSHGDKVITIFSSSNYLGLGNRGGVLVLSAKGSTEETWDPLPKCQPFPHKTALSLPDYFTGEEEEEPKELPTMVLKIPAKYTIKVSATIIVSSKRVSGRGTITISPKKGKGKSVAQKPNKKRKALRSSTGNKRKKEVLGENRPTFYSSA